MERIYCVYVHINQKNQKAYVGITSIPVKERWQYGNGYRKQPKFYNAIKKYGWNNFDHIILEDNILGEKEALKKETFYIKQYDSINNGYNVLEEGQKSSPYCFQGIRIYCIETGTYYDSIAEAARKLGFPEAGDIEKVIRKERNGCYGLHFIKAEDVNKQNIRETLKKQTGRNRKIFCIETQTIFESQQDAAIFCGKKPQSVMLNCQGKHSNCGGYHFKYLDEIENIEELYPMPYINVEDGEE